MLRATLRATLARPALAHHRGRRPAAGPRRRVDFCVVGSGAGGSIAAATLAQAGARVAIVEEGAHHTKRDFNMQEAGPTPPLSEHGNRTTEDLAIMIPAGRAVGGGTR